MPVRADMLNGHAICHGGLIFTLADSAFAFACNSYNFNTVASGCGIDFVAPAREGDCSRRARHERALAGGRASTTSRSPTSAARRSRSSAARATGSRDT
jgi:phenylacetic acid degradation protein PaaD